MAQETMRAVDIKGGAGPVSSLFINSEIPKPVPTAQQCLIKVKAFGLNRADCLQREGKYPMPPWAPKIMGLEFAGIVEKVGHGKEEEERHNWKEGDEVFGLAYGGTYAEYVAINKKMLLRKPSDMDWTYAAGLPEVWFTALQALHLVGRYDPAKTKAVVWHAGASSVSIAGIQLSTHANKSSAYSMLPYQSPGSASEPPKVYATARQDEKCDFVVQKLGATAAFNTKKNKDWAAALKEANGGQGVDLIIDYVGADYFQQNLDLLNMDGAVVQLAAMSGTKLPEGTDIGNFVKKRIRFEGSTLRSRDPGYQGLLRDMFEKEVLPGLLDGKYESHTDTVIPWEKIQEAHQKLENNETKGKVVCTIG